MGGRVQELNSHSELEPILARAGNNLTVIDFSAAWCGPCKMIAPYYAELSDKSEFSSVEFVKVDVDTVEQTAQQYSVEAMPTFVFIKNGKEISDARLTGASKDRLLAAINKYK